MRARPETMHFSFRGNNEIGHSISHTERWKLIAFLFLRPLIIRAARDYKYAAPRLKIELIAAARVMRRCARCRHPLDERINFRSPERVHPAVLLPCAEILITLGEEITFNLRNRSYLQIFIST